MAPTSRKHTSNNGNRFIRRAKRWFRQLTGQSNSKSHHHRSSAHRHTPVPLPVPVPVRSTSRDNSSYFAKVTRRLKRRLRRLTGKSSSRGRHSKPAVVFDPSSLIPDSERSRPRVQSKYPRLKKIIRRIKTRFRNLTGGKSRRVHHSRSSSKVQVPIFTPAAVKEKSVFRDYFPYFVNSTMMFLLAYLVAWLTYQFALIFTASLFHIDSVLFYYKVVFPPGASSPLWSVFNIIVIMISGPVTALITGLLYYIYIVRKKKFRGNIQMFFIWLIIHSFCMFFAAFVAGTITSKGFGYAIIWMRLTVGTKIVISSIFLSVLTLIGYLGTRYILETSNSISRIRSINRNVFIITQTILPWLIGSMLLAPIKYAETTLTENNYFVNDFIILICVAFMIVPSFFNKTARPHLSSDKLNHQKTQISRWAAVITIASLVVFRGGLSYGLHIIINLSMSISLYK